MRPKAWHIPLVLAALLIGPLLISCQEKGTEPKDELNVSNDNPHCGLVAGFVRNSAGQGVEGATVSISPAASAPARGTHAPKSLASFLNYPNPFTSDTYFIYYLSDEEALTVRISLFDLHQELQREFTDAPAAKGANKLYFDGLDNQQELLPNGLYPCEILVQSAGGTDSLRIALAKNVNIASEGGLQSYTATTESDGKYVIANVPLNILLQTTTTFAPEDSLVYPVNWPYVETLWEVTDRFGVSARKEGYAAAEDTVTLTPGRVTRVDFSLK